MTDVNEKLEEEILESELQDLEDAENAQEIQEENAS